MMFHSASLAEEPLLLDGHAHIACADYVGEAFLDGVAANLGRQLLSQGLDISHRRLRRSCDAQFDDPHCDILVRQMDEAGIASTVLLLPDFTWVLRGGSLTIAEMIERHFAVLTRHPGRFFLFVGVDPRWGADGVSLFERAISEHGAHGLKLYPPCGYSPSDSALYPYYEICRAHACPVLLHTGGTSPALALDMGYPRLVDAAARNFPEVNFILAHATSCYSDEAVMLAGSRPNIYLDVSGFQGHAKRRLRQIFECGVNHKLIFGTDWPVFRLQGPQKTFVDSIRNDDEICGMLNAVDRRGFWGGTMRSLLPRESKRRPLESSLLKEGCA